MSKKSSRNRSQPNQASWKERMHLVEFSIDDELGIKDWYVANKPEPWPCLEELVDKGWAVKITPPGDRDDYWLSATCKDKRDDFKDHTFTVKYPDYEKGLCLLYYVITVLVDDGKFDLKATPASRDWL